MSAAPSPAPSSASSSLAPHDPQKRAAARARWRLFAGLGLCTLTAGALTGVAAIGCSKGGAPDPDSTCRKLTDPDPNQPDTMKPPMGLVAELRSPTTGTLVPVLLDGTGGTYAGTHTFGKCDEAGVYYVERISLVDISNTPVAVATRSGSAYTIAYQNGLTDAVSGTGFTNLTVNFASPATAVQLNVQSVSAQPLMLKQGDKVSFSAAVSGDDCGIKDSKWWLSSSTIDSMVTTPVAIEGGSGQGSLRVPTMLSPGSYFLEGSITLKSGRVFKFQRASLGDTTYKLVDTRTSTPSATTVPVVQFTVAENTDADRVAPQSLGMEAKPASLPRCEKVSFTLKMTDDKALPSAQSGQAWVGPLSNPRLLKVPVTGGGDTLFGSFIVPSDAPTGVWYAFPMTFEDAAGNVGTGDWKGDGKFTISGQGITTPVAVPAATFIVENPLPVTLPDMAVPADLGTATPDLAPAQLPAKLASVSVSPASVTMDDQVVTVTVTWADNAKILK